MTIPINPLDWIPNTAKQQILDNVLDFLANLAEKTMGDKSSEKIKRLKSDGGFQKAVDVGIVRATARFVKEYGQEDEDLVAAISNDEKFWQAKSVRDALVAILQHPGHLEEKDQATIVKHFDDVLPQRVNRTRVDRAATYFLRCLAEEVWHLPELRPIYELQLQRISVDRAEAMLHELQGLRSDFQQTMLALARGIDEQHILLGNATTLALPEPPKVLHNLPNPDFVHFVGREAELRQLRELLSSKHRIGVITVDGVGGIGKSALALETAYYYLSMFDELPIQDRFDAIIWVSGKATALTTEGIVLRLQVTRTLDDIYGKIALTLRHHDILHANIQDQDNLIRNALSRRRTLLIIDNLETIDDTRVNAFLLDFPSPSKCIVTSRHRIDAAYPIRLTGMSQTDALALMKQECDKKIVVLTSSEQELLFRRTGGLPLAIVWSIAQIGRGYPAEAILRRLGQPVPDINRYCFENAMQEIQGKPSHKLLLSLCLFEINASREGLGKVANLPDLDRDDGLVELEGLSLINKQGVRYEMLEVTKTYARGQLESVSDWAGLARQRWLNYMIEKFDHYAVHADFLAQDANASNVEDEIENARAALDWCVHNNPAAAVELAYRVSTFLYAVGMVNHSIDIASLGLEMSRQTENLVSECDFLTHLGLRYAWKDQYLDAEKSLALAAELSRQLQDYPQDNILEYRGSNLMRQGEYDQAEKFLRASLAIREKLGDQRLVVLGKYLMGVLAYRRGNDSDALEHLNQALAEARSIEYSRAVSYIQNYIGNANIRLGKYDDAENCLKESLAIATLIHDARRIARLKESMSLLAEAKGNRIEARICARDGKKLFHDLGMEKDAKKLADRHDALNRVVFLDRDGTLNVDAWVTFKPEQFKLVDGVIEGLVRLKDWGFEFVIVTNQTGIATGKFGVEDMHKFNALLLQTLSQHNISISRIEFCPFDPVRGEGEFQRESERRKPNPGMLIDAAQELAIELGQHTYMIGDKFSDILAGRRAGCNTILVKTGILDDADKYTVTPDKIAENLVDAAHWIGEREGFLSTSHG